MNDLNEQPVVATEPLPGASPVEHTTPPAATNGEVHEVNGTTVDAEPAGRWHAEAGRKGAHRVHQLIEAGRRYEQEHGLKRGRQRLRQLIELGKLYEEEHGLRPARTKRQRLSRAERQDVVATLLRCLHRIAKPAYRAEIARLVAALDAGPNRAA